MEPQRYTPEERGLFEQEVAQQLRTELPSMREEEIRAAARRAAARELEQQRDALRDELDDEVVAITEEPADLRAVANREAPSKVLLGTVLLLLLLFTLAVFGQLPWANASALGLSRPAATPRVSFNPIGNGGATALSAPVAAATPRASTLVASSPAAAAASVQPAMLPQTGAPTANDLFVDPLFGQAYWREGGVKRFGRPTTALVTENGLQVQWFEHARFVYHPQHANTPQAVVIDVQK